MAIAHKDRSHATLAPSAAHRWIECPGSIALSAGVEGKSSVFAAEGTAAHELASQCLTNGFDADHYADYVIDISAPGIATRFLMPGAPLGDDDTRFVVDEEMVEGVQLYVDYVRKLASSHGKGENYEIEVEVRLDMRHIHRSIFGTGDTILYDKINKRLHVLDFKYGKGVVVDVTANPQLLTYAAGAAHLYHNREVRAVFLHIVQPRAPHQDGAIRTYQLDLIDLMEFEQVLGNAARATEDPDAPLHAGDWCRFCPALAFCPEARRHSTEAALAEFAEPARLSPEQLTKVLGEADLIGDWVKAVQVFAHAEAVAGRCPEGYKLVPKRAMRRWKDDCLAEAAFSALFDPAAIYTEPKFKSPAQIEKAIGKKTFACMTDLVTKVSSGTNLVPLSDPRAAAKADGLEEFANE